jgi:hypothetical protein
VVSLAPVVASLGPGLATAAAVLVLAGCGATEVAATVDGRTISAGRVEAILEHAGEEYGREGKHFPAPGTGAYRLLSDQALDLLVYRAELEQSAAQLGVTVADDEVEARLQGREDDAGEEGEAGGKDDERIREEAVRSSLLYRRIYDRVADGIRVRPAQVDRVYKRRRDLYGTQGLSSAEGRRQVARDLETAARNARMARWVAAMRARFAPKIAYHEGFSAPDGTPTTAR